VPFNPGSGGGGASPSRVVISEDGTREDFYVNGTLSSMSKKVTASEPLQDESTVEIYGPQFRGDYTNKAGVAESGGLAYQSSTGSLVNVNPAFSGQGDILFFNKDFSITGGIEGYIPPNSPFNDFDARVGEEDPGGVALQSNGSVWVAADAEGSFDSALVLRQFDRDGNLVDYFTDPPSLAAPPYGGIPEIVLDQDDCLIVPNPIDNRIVTLDLNGSYQNAFPTSFGPSVIDLTADSSILAANGVNSPMRRYTPDESLGNENSLEITDKGYPTPNTYALAALDNGQVFLSTGSNFPAYTEKLTGNYGPYQAPERGVKPSLVTDTSIDFVLGAGFLPDDTFVFANSDGIYSSDLDGSNQSLITGGANDVFAVDKNGSFFSKAGYELEKIDQTGSRVAKADNSYSGRPVELAVDGNNCVISAGANNTIQKFTNDLSSQVYVKDAPPELESAIAAVNGDLVLQGKDNNTFQYYRATSVSSGLSIVDSVSGKRKAFFDFGDIFNKNGSDQAYTLYPRPQTIFKLDLSQPSSIKLVPDLDFGVQRKNTNTDVKFFGEVGNDYFAARAKPDKADSITRIELQF